MLAEANVVIFASRFDPKWSGVVSISDMVLGVVLVFRTLAVS